MRNHSHFEPDFQRHGYLSWLAYQFGGQHRDRGRGRRFGRFASGLADDLEGHGRGFRSGRKLSSDDLQLVILALIHDKPRHGYEIIKALEERSKGFYVPSPGVVYPSLTYLEEAGYTAFDVEGSRKLYRLTEAGRSYFAQHSDTAAAILSEIERVGLKMERFREAFAADDASERERGSHRRGHRRHARDTGDMDSDLERSRAALRSALGDVHEIGALRRSRHHSRGPDASSEEQARVAAILDRATAEIRALRSGSPTATPSPAGVLLDPKIDAVIARLQAARRRSPGGGPRSDPDASRDPHAHAETGFSIHPEQGELIYVLCRALGAKRAAEFATSLGMSTLYLAAAVRDNGGGQVIGSEIVPEKIAAAKRNLDEAGLAHLVDIRQGDATQTLRDLGGPVDFVLIDGWPGGEAPSLARQVIEIVAPQLRAGALVLNDNGEPDYLAYVRDPANGFRSITLPIKGNNELSVKI
jgi:predicted O-methyltransferase YrrM/DNA-binding PadR family transcriptional regulator